MSSLVKKKMAKVNTDFHQKKSSFVFSFSRLLAKTVDVAAFVSCSLKNVTAQSSLELMCDVALPVEFYFCWKHLLGN